MRTIRITGTSHLKVEPDLTIISLSKEDTFLDYDDAMKNSAKTTEKLKDLFAELGFQRSELKTLYFNIDTKYETYKVKEVYKQKFCGYNYNLRMKIEFASDNELLGKILYKLANCPLNPEFHISFTVKDTESAKSKLLAMAIADAKEKALIMSNAAGVELKEIQSSDYSWGQINFEVQQLHRSNFRDDDCGIRYKRAYTIELDPDYIDVSDTVTVIWEIN